MAAEDVAEALMRFDDPEVRRRVGDGDFTVLADLSLSVAERRLVSEATAVLPDGHPAKVPLEAGEVKGHAASGLQEQYWPAGTARAIEYVLGDLQAPDVQARFVAWQGARADQFP